MREIVLDTETTGLDPKSGHKIVEIGCVELENHLPTGQTFHRYLNPERDMPDGAFQVHGLSEEFLADYPVFAAEADAFLDFIGDSPLVIHNAEFDMRFLNWELQILGYPLLPMERAIDTVAMARKKFPGSPANLDALCRRFDIDNAAREKHGALLDAELLAEVYLELIGGREPGLALASRRKAADMARLGENKTKEIRIARPHAPTSDEALSWEKFVEKINDPIWKQ